MIHSLGVFRQRSKRGYLAAAVFFCFAAVFGIFLLRSTYAAAATIGFVQGNYADPSTPQRTVTVPFTAAQIAGDLNVVVVGWFDTTSTVNSVSDSQGNVYALAVGPSSLTGTGSESIYYAKNIAAAAANANVVTVTFSAAAPYPDIRILEYNGIDPVTPIDVASSATGSGSPSKTSAFTTTNANDLLIGANNTTTVTEGPGAGFTTRIITKPDGDIVEDRVVTTVGNYSATAVVASGSWVMQAVAFRAAGNAAVTPDTTPPSDPSSLTAAAANNTQINLSWNGSTDPDSPSITYHVERCAGNGCTSFAEIAAPTAATFNDTGLSSSTSYSYRVRASDPSKNFSSYSNTASATTPAAPIAPPAALAFIQGNYSVPSTPQTTVTVPFTAAQTAGNLSVVAVGWTNSNPAVVSSVTDTAGNAYLLAVGPTVLGSSEGQAIYYAKNIVAAAANANAVTVSFTSAAAYPEIRILEYRGVNPVNPLDTIAAASGNSATSSSGSMATTVPADLLIAANRVQTTTRSPGAGFASRMITKPDGDIVEDLAVTTTGSYTATANLSAAGGWVMQMVAFRAAGSAPSASDTTPPSVPSNLTVAAVNNTQISLSWTASTDPDSPSITYQVDRCAGNGCNSFTELAILPENTTSFLDEGLANATSYSYRVKAADPTGNLSNYSIVATTTTGSQGAPSSAGQWAGPFAWPMVGIHLTLMPNGKVLTWEDENASPAAQVWDPSSMSFTAVPYNPSDLFCSGHTVLPDGRVMVAGGHISDYNGIPASTFFDPNTSTWLGGPAMSFSRWYPTVTALPDGRALVTSGAINCQGCNADTPEVFDPVANAWTQLANATMSLPLYPHMFVLPDGRVLAAGSYELPIPASVLDVKAETWTTIDTNVLDAGSSVMYLPGKIMKSGTSANSNPPYTAAVANAYVLDMTQPSPAWQPAGPMAFPRSFHNLTILPDGNVLVTGGESFTNPFDLSAAVYAAELWSPATQASKVMASMQTPRVYHSTALLLPDGRVLVAGSGEYGTGSIKQLNAEIYSPPYLFNGSRPTIVSVPSTLQYGQPFTVGTPDAANIASVALVRLGSVTHGFNQNQRFVPLTFAAGSGNLTVTAPTNANLAPPGWYMLFVLNSSGVPSVAKFVKF